MIRGRLPAPPRSLAAPPALRVHRPSRPAAPDPALARRLPPRRRHAHPALRAGWSPDRRPPGDRPDRPGGRSLLRRGWSLARPVTRGRGGAGAPGPGPPDRPASRRRHMGLARGQGDPRRDRPPRSGARGRRAGRARGRADRLRRAPPPPAGGRPGGARGCVPQGCPAPRRRGRGAERARPPRRPRLAAPRLAGDPLPAPALGHPPRLHLRRAAGPAPRPLGRGGVGPSLLPAGGAPGSRPGAPRGPGMAGGARTPPGSRGDLPHGNASPTPRGWGIRFRVRRPRRGGST